MVKETPEEKLIRLGIERKPKGVHEPFITKGIIPVTKYVCSGTYTVDKLGGFRGWLRCLKAFSPEPSTPSGQTCLNVSENMRGLLSYRDFI